jgi:hypothetical protein
MKKIRFKTSHLAQLLKAKRMGIMFFMSMRIATGKQRGNFRCIWSYIVHNKLNIKEL